MKLLSLHNVLFIAAATAAAPLTALAGDYKVFKAGLYDASTTAISHTASTGLQLSNFSIMDALGNAVGTSTRYLPNATTTAGNNAWYFNAADASTTTIGLTDALHTSSTGTQLSTPVAISANGMVTGTSGLYGLFGTTGLSGWAYTPGGAPIRIGLFGDGYFNTDNNVASTTVFGIDNNGHVVGTSVRYSGITTAGTDAYYYSPTGSSVAIGLATTGPNAANYTSSGGLRSNIIARVTGDGFVAGTTANYSSTRTGGVTTRYTDAFLYNPNAVGGPTTKLISPTTNDNTYGDASVTAMNSVAVGGNIGLSANLSSQNAWVYNIGSDTTTQTGLASTGVYLGTVSSTHSNSVSALNANGKAIGAATIYATQTIFNSSTSTTTTSDGNAGSDAYYFDGTNSTPIGLIDAQHTANPPVKLTTVSGSSTRTSYTIRANTASSLNDSNQIVGTAVRYNTVSGTTSAAGSNAWFHDPAVSSTSTVIGLVDSAHTSSDGVTQTNGNLSRLTNSGLVYGTSTRYTGTTAKGADAWYYSTTTSLTKPLGPTDAVYTSGDATTRQITPSFITESGLIAGTAARYTSSGTTTNGADVWLYDSLADLTYTLTPSLNATTGFASATVNYLGENGLVLGTFVKNPNASNVGTFDLYAYMKGQSIIDLGAAPQDLTVTGFASLASWFAGNPLGTVAAYGLLVGEPAGSRAALIFSSVPEPTSLALFSAIGTIVLARRRKRA